MKLRPLSTEPGERAFVVSAWVNSFSTSDMAKLATFGGYAPRVSEWAAGPGYYGAWNALVDDVLERSQVTVADDDGLLAGYVVWGQERDTVLHYIYTRLSYRAQGVARELLSTLPLGPIVYTHRSRGVRSVPAGWQYSLAPLFGVVDRKREAA